MLMRPSLSSYSIAELSNLPKLVKEIKELISEIKSDIRALDIADTSTVLPYVYESRRYKIADTISLGFLSKQFDALEKAYKKNSNTFLICYQKFLELDKRFKRIILLDRRPIADPPPQNAKKIFTNSSMDKTTKESPHEAYDKKTNYEIIKKILSYLHEKLKTVVKKTEITSPSYFKFPSKLLSLSIKDFLITIVKILDFCPFVLLSMLVLVEDYFQKNPTTSFEPLTIKNLLLACLMIADADLNDTPYCLKSYVELFKFAPSHLNALHTFVQNGFYSYDKNDNLISSYILSSEKINVLMVRLGIILPLKIKMGNKESVFLWPSLNQITTHPFQKRLELQFSESASKKISFDVSPLIISSKPSLFARNKASKHYSSDPYLVTQIRAKL